MQTFTFNLATNNPKKLYRCQSTEENVSSQLIWEKCEEVVTMYADNQIVSSLLRKKTKSKLLNFTFLRRHGVIATSFTK